MAREFNQVSSGVHPASYSLSSRGLLHEGMKVTRGTSGAPLLHMRSWHASGQLSVTLIVLETVFGILQTLIAATIEYILSNKNKFIETVKERGS
jgi:hypothetical protein